MAVESDAQASEADKNGQQDNSQILSWSNSGYKPCDDANNDASNEGSVIRLIGLRLALGRAMVTVATGLFVSAPHPTVTSDARETGD